MGSKCSKTPDRSNTRASNNFNLTTMAPRNNVGYSDSDVTVQSIHMDDLHNINVIKQELDQDPQVCVVNNILMTIHFFADHKEVIKRLQHTSASPQEKEMNKTLLKQETMECTCPDAILEEVNKNVLFRGMEEHSKSENLVAKRMYVINDLIEVVNSKEVPQYTSIDKPSYQVRMEESSRKGYVKLQQVEVTTPVQPSQSSDEEYGPIPGPSSRSDSEYDYMTFTALKTPQILEVDSSQRRDTLPETCFSSRKRKKNHSDYADKFDPDYIANLSEEDLMEDVVYINSKGFMNYFWNIFRNSLGNSLGFDEEAISMTTAIPGKFFCEEMDVETNVIKSYEIIPAVSIKWPDDMTYEFILRDDRPTIIDMRSGIKYRWPTDGPKGMINEIRDMSCVLVPKGYMKKKGVHEDSKLEWEIHFPKAERYLEARMSHAQMKCFLILLTLYKTYIAPITKQYGLLPEHIRTHIYWECESDYKNWPEHRLGTKLLRVIKNLQQRLFLGILPDYFIKENNLFENIPKKYLQCAQKVLLEILASPAPYFIYALRNLRYTSAKFYPTLNLKDLYSDLTSNKSIGLLNPKLINSQKPLNLKKMIYKEPEQQIRHLRDLKRKEAILRKRMEEKEEQETEKKREKVSDDWINLDVPIDKKLDPYKTKKVLEIFVKMFIDIARKSSQISTKEQALLYLKQAFYLTQIIEEKSPAFREEVEEFKKIISMEENAIKRKAVRSVSNEEKPPTPVRNSISFQYEGSNISQHIRSNSIKLNNLHTSFQNGLPPPQPSRSLKPQKNESFKKNGVGTTRSRRVAFVE